MDKEKLLEERMKPHHFHDLCDRQRLTHGMLVNDISRLFDACIRRENESLCMAHGNRRLFFHLVHNDGVSQQELVRMTHLTAPSVSVALRKMEADGLIERRQGTEDMRQVHVYLTEKGRELDMKILERIKETEKKMLIGFEDEEKKEFKEYLLRVVDNLLGEGKEDK